MRCYSSWYHAQNAGAKASCFYAPLELWCSLSCLCINLNVRTACCFGTHQDWGFKDITLQPIRLVLCERQIEYQTLLQQTSRNNLIFMPWSQSSVITYNLTKLRWLDYDMVFSSKWRILSKSVDSQILRGSQLFQKKGMRSEARGNKWIKQIIHQCTPDQIQVKVLIR